MIFAAGFSMSEIIMNLPFPLSAQPWIRLYDAPFPMPMQWTLQYLVLFLTILITPVVFETPPSVNMNTCLGYPSWTFYRSNDWRGS